MLSFWRGVYSRFMVIFCFILRSVAYILFYINECGINTVSGGLSYCRAMLELYTF